GASPYNCIKDGVFVFQREVYVSIRVLSLEAGHLAAHTNITVGVLNRAFERRRELRDGPFHNVVESGLYHNDRISCEGDVPCYTNGDYPLKAPSAFHEYPHPRLRRTRTRAGLENRGEPANRQALLRPGQCRYRARSRVRGARP